MLNHYISNGNNREDIEVIWEYMTSQSLKLDTKVFQSLVQSYLQSEDLNSAMSVLKVMALKGVQPDKVLYETLVHGACKLGEVDRALVLFERLKLQINVPVNLYRTLMKGLLDAGRLAEVHYVAEIALGGREVMMPPVYNIAMVNESRMR